MVTAIRVRVQGGRSASPHEPESRPNVYIFSSECDRTFHFFLNGGEHMITVIRVSVSGLSGHSIDGLGGAHSYSRGGHRDRRSDTDVERTTRASRRVSREPLPGSVDVSREGDPGCPFSDSNATEARLPRSDSLRARSSVSFLA